MMGGVLLLHVDLPKKIFLYYAAGSQLFIFLTLPTYGFGGAAVFESFLLQ